MSLKFIESIKLEDKRVLNLEFHQARVNQTYLKFFPKTPPLDLSKSISAYLSKNNLTKNSIWKIRIEYQEKSYLIEVNKYQKKKIHHLRIIEINDYNYSYKFANRSFLDNLLLKNPDVDDLILTRNGFVTDSTYANIVCLKNNKYYTPSTYLLNGTKRQNLLEKKLITEKNIQRKDLHKYDSLCLINAMLELEELNIDITNII